MYQIQHPDVPRFPFKEDSLKIKTGQTGPGPSFLGVFPVVI